MGAACFVVFCFGFDGLGQHTVSGPIVLLFCHSYVFTFLVLVGVHTLGGGSNGRAGGRVSTGELCRGSLLNDSPGVMDIRLCIYLCR